MTADAHFDTYPAPDYATDEAPPDPYLDAPTGAGQGGESDLDRLAAIVAVETSRTVDLPIPDVNGRAGVTLRMQVGNLTGDQLQRWQKTARRGRRDDVDGFAFNALVVANQCEAILVRGKVMHDPDGDPYTFRSSDFIARLQRKDERPITAAEAARRFVGSDGVIGSISASVLFEAGFGADLDPADPTAGG